MVLGASNDDEDDMNIPIILLKRSGRKNSCHPHANEGKMPSAARPKKPIMYRRTRFKGPSRKVDSCHLKINLEMSAPTINLTAPVNVVEVPTRPESATCFDYHNGKQVDEQSQSVISFKDTIGTVIQLVPPRKLEDSGEGFSDSIELVHQKVNRVEERVKYDQLDRASMENARKDRQSMLRARQKARIAMRRTSMATKPLIAGLQQTHSVPFLMSGPLVTAHKLSLSGPSNLNAGCSGSCSQQPLIGPSDSSLQQFTPRLFSASGNNMKISREKCQEINSHGSNSLVHYWFEEELDALWVGVRRHGEGNWESILKDPILHFSSNKQPEHLSQRWSMERPKAVGVSQEPVRLPEEQLPIVAEAASGDSKKRCPSVQKNGVIDFQKQPAEKQSLFLGGVFRISDAIAGFAKTNDSSHTKGEVSSEGTISD